MTSGSLKALHEASPLNSIRYRPTLGACITFSIFAAALVFCCGDSFLAPPDCASYWAWGESLLAHLNFDFRNSYSQHQMPVLYCYITPTGRLSNDWPPGSGLILLPAMAFGPYVAHLWLLLLACGAGGVWWRSSNAAVRIKAIATAAVVMGTPLFFYAMHGPFFSHLPSFAVTTCFLVVWQRTLKQRSAREWFILGLLLGFSAVIRPQNILLGIVLAAELPTFLGRPRLALRAIGAGVCGLLLGLAPRFPIYTVLYGNPLALPKLEEMHWLSPNILPMLFSDFHGVLPWTPVYALAVAGLLLLLRSNRTLAAGFLLAFALQVYVNAANLVWWSGGSFGNRRLADSAIIVGYGIVALLEYGKSRRWRLASTFLTLLCCVWTTGLVLAERRLLVPLDRYIPFTTRSFWNDMMLVWLQPIQTLRAVTRPLSEGSLLTRFMASVVFGCALATLLVLLSRSTRRGLNQVALPAAIMAVALSVLVLIGSIRTPRIEDKELTASLPKTSGILWDNYIELAYYHVARGEWSPAAGAADRAIHVQPGHYSGWWYRGIAKQGAGDTAKAVEAFDTVLRLKPDHVEAARRRAIAAQSPVMF